MGGQVTEFLAAQQIPVASQDFARESDHRPSGPMMCAAEDCGPVPLSARIFTNTVTHEGFGPLARAFLREGGDTCKNFG